MNKFKITFNDNTFHIVNIITKSNYILLTYEDIQNDLLYEFKFEKLNIDEIERTIILSRNVKNIEVIKNEE